MREEARAGRREGVEWRRRNWHARGVPDSRLGVRARVERTWNMAAMVVTLEVSQLEMSALKFWKPRKSSLMSVMAETSQSAIGPYVAIASAGSVLYAWTAVFSDAVSVKVRLPS